MDELARLGWTDGRNIRFEQRWTNGDANRASAFATELIGSQPDVIFCSTTAVTAVLHRETSTIPIVFAIVSDPSGFIAGQSHPGGNITGFTNIEAPMGGKWHRGRHGRQVAQFAGRSRPASNEAAFVFNPETAPAGGKHFLTSFEAAAGSRGIEPAAMRVRSDAEIETAVATSAASKRAPSITISRPGYLGRPKSKWLGPVKGPRSAVDADASESQHRKRPAPALPLPAPPLPVRPQPELQVRLRPVH